ncbi:DNA repair exonuclease [Halobacteriales archaeon QS_3_64_16]|nr:MAG: DNA repair exonuclease [Halobacteriales archaeon QS_3_64_16]
MYAPELRGSNRMVTLLHTADTHLGYRQYHRPEREADFREAFYEAIEQAITRDVDAVVHAGDLFNSSRPGIDALSDTLEGLKRLAAADIPFLSIVGNHDGTRDQQWIDVFESLGLATRLGESGYTIRSGENGDGTEASQVALYGLDHVEPGRRDRLEYDFNPKEATDADAALLVAHGLFEPFPNGDWDARAICRRSSVELDAILAGDDHTNQETTLSEFGTSLSYPGSTERTAADQRDRRKFDLVEVSSAGEIERRSVELETREFVYVDVDMREGDGLDRVLEAIEEVEEETVLADAVLVVTLTGGGERVSSGPIEERGLGRDALTVRVNDRREFDNAGGEYGEVAFADPDRAVEQRRQTVGLSENGREIEELVRETDAVPDSNVTETVEARVREWLDGSPEAFERSEPDSADEMPVDAGSEGNWEPASGEPADVTAANEASSDVEPTSEPALDAEGDESASGTEGEPSNGSAVAEGTASETAAVESAMKGGESDAEERNRGEDGENGTAGRSEENGDRTTQSTLWD